MIIEQVNLHHFIDRFKDHARDDQFSYDALTFIHDYLEQLSDDIGRDIELDVIEICTQWCEFTEAEFLAEFAAHEGQSIDEAIDASDCAVYKLENGNYLSNEIY